MVKILAIDHEQYPDYNTLLLSTTNYNWICSQLSACLRFLEEETHNAVGNSCEFNDLQ